MKRLPTDPSQTSLFPAMTNVTQRELDCAGPLKGQLITGGFYRISRLRRSPAACACACRRLSLQIPIFVIGVFLLAAQAAAYDLPPVNLGSTSFFDGAVPPTGPGLYGMQFFTFYGADRLTDAHGKRLPLPRQHLHLEALTTQLIYASPAKIFGSASPGAIVIIPTVVGAAADDGLGGTALRADTGLADTLFGAFLSFDPIGREGRPLLAQSLEFDIIAPTGHYSRRVSVTPGSNFLSLDPFYAATAWLTPELTISGRFHWLWNATNDAPKEEFGPAARSSQAGQAFHMNLAAHYQLDHSWGIGVAGYFLQQVTDTRVNGTPVPGRRERVFAIGPGLTYSINRDYSVFLNAYQEFGAENRPEGTKILARLNVHF